MLKILHTGDVHLDSPFSKLDIGHAQIRRAELRSSFSAMIQYVRSNFIDLFLIAGDLFDTEFVTRETVEFLRMEFARIPDCKVVISPGNHDPIAENSVYERYDFGSNVYVFPQPLLSHFYFEKLNTYVYGYAFEQESLRHCPFAGYRAEDPNAINVLLGHADFAVDSRYCPVDEKRIASFGADYTALGHVHNAPEIVTLRGGAYAYCGCPEPRGFDEVGEKGAVYVEIEKTDDVPEVKCTRIRFAKRRYEKIKVNVDGFASSVAVENAVKEAIEANGFGSDTLLRVTLVGRIAPTIVLSESALAARLDTVFFAEVRDNTLPLHDVEYIKEDPTVKGEFCRRMLPLLEDEDEEKRALATMALRYGLAAITGEDLSDIAGE